MSATGAPPLCPANANGGNGDAILHNQGNDALGRAQLTVLPLPHYPSGVSTNKVTIVDLDEDGRPDVVAMTADRPAILRNVSAGGGIAFLDWTPGSAFPAGGALAGMSAGVLDSNGDGDLDLLVGALTDDHLFERTAGRDVRAAELAGGALPALLNEPALAVRGSLGAGEVRTFDAGAIGETGTLSLLLRDRGLVVLELPAASRRGPADWVLEVLRDGAVVATSDRGGAGVSEVLAVALSAGDWSLRVTNQGAEPASYVLEALARRDGPDNDLCENPMLIGDGLTPFTNQGAQTDGPAHAACLDFGDDGIQSDVWFVYQATCTGTLTVSTCGLADYDTKIGVYAGVDCPVNDVTLLGCNEDTAGCSNYTSMVTVPAVVGEWYRVRVGGWLGAQGSGMLAIDCR